ncbi:MAG: sugar phosphate isomerase/epimerase [Opitutaceae bacterium]|nr:sugar phosphate isomerase/epimerase [Opitutaceae bacterium]MBP9913950.1 sugar phosphate isomerase/epimerase [Opitutaceae bacterium]
MQYAGHIYLWTELWSDREVGLFQRARALGLNLLEISVGDDVQFDPALTKRAAADAGMGVVIGPGGQWPDGADLSDDEPSNCRLAFDWHRKQIDLAVAMGALGYSGAIYGRPGKVLKRRPPPDEYARTAEGLHGLAAYAQQAGVALALEPMSRFRTHLVNTPAQALRLVELAAHPHLKISIDTYHAATEVRDLPAAIRAAGSKLWALHACENDRGVPGGGLMPWQEILAAVRETSAEFIEFESYNTSLGDFGWKRGLFQNVCPDGDAFVRQGLEFIRSLMK